MAEASKAKKPRIRKAPQTMREKAEAAQNKVEKPKKRRVRGVAGKASSQAARPFKAINSKRPKVNLPQNRLTRIMAKIFGPIWRAICWFPAYFAGAWREVKQVTWPSRKETWRLTLAVFIFAIVFGSLAWVVDKGLDELFKEVILK